jgi:hypothetical protein
MQRCSRQTDGTTVAGGVQTNAAMRPPVRMACGFLSNSGLDLRPAVTTEPDSQGDDLDCSQQNLFWCATRPRLASAETSSAMHNPQYTGGRMTHCTRDTPPAVHTAHPIHGADVHGGRKTLEGCTLCVCTRNCRVACACRRMRHGYGVAVVEQFRWSKRPFRAERDRLAPSGWETID